MAAPASKTWRIIKYSYVGLAIVCLALGSAILVGVLMTRLYLGVPIVLTLFFASSARILYLGWKSISFDGTLLEVSAPCWFRCSVAIDEISQCELIQTDSITVEREAGKDFVRHQPNLAKTYAAARALVRCARWLSLLEGRFGAAPTAAPLLALRFWFKDGTRSEIQLPDDPKVTPALVQMIEGIANDLKS